MPKNQKDLSELIKRYLEGKCTAEEQRYVDQWYSSMGSRNANISSEELPNSELLLNSIGTRLRENITRHARTNPTFGTHKRSDVWRYTAIAASVVLLVVAGLVPYYLNTFEVSQEAAVLVPLNEVIYNESTESKTVVLVDGSKILISPKSALTVAFTAESKVRTVTLKGEASFDIASDKSKPFYVYASGIVTKVLGTSFIVSAYDGDDHTKVSVQEGKVSVYTEHQPEQNSVVLLPNQEAVYNRITKVVEATIVENPAPVVDINKFEVHFDEKPIDEILEDMKRMYGVDIIFDKSAFSKCVLTTTFYDEEFYERLDIISTAIGSAYKKVDTKIVMSSPTCAHP